MSKLNTLSRRSHVSLLCILTNLFSSSPLAWLRNDKQCHLATTIVKSFGLVKCLYLLPRTEGTKYSGKMHEIFKAQKFVFYWCAFPNFEKESV